MNVYLEFVKRLLETLAHEFLFYLQSNLNNLGIMKDPKTPKKLLKIYKSLVFIEKYKG